MTRIAENDMKLPAGHTCSDCRHFARCQKLCSRRGDETECDWSPSMFTYDMTRLLAENAELQAQLAASGLATRSEAPMEALANAHAQIETLQAEVEALQAEVCQQHLAIQDLTGPNPPMDKVWQSVEHLYDVLNSPVTAANAEGFATDMAGISEAVQAVYDA